MARRPVPEGIRITKVGLWYVLFTMVVAVAATNTGNNALYMVLAMLLSLLVVSGVVSKRNLGHLELDLEPPAEIFAKRPFELAFVLHNRARLLSRWLLQLSVTGPAARGRRAVATPLGSPLLIVHLPPRGQSRGRIEMLLRRRGRHQVGHAHVASIFPLGFFRKGLRYPLALEVLVYPELFPAATVETELEPRAGDEPARRAGWGHELHALRTFRPGDDPRSIHWKQTARTGQLIAMEREIEESRRLTIVFDNAVVRGPAGATLDEAAQERFERLVSEAATAAVDHLERGFEVELVTRDGVVAAGGGPTQRRALLEELAVVAPVPAVVGDLMAERRGRLLRLGGAEELAA
jgi:uncharacterized protein (DUF58 family)